jgi:hypothetical protein
MPREDEGLRQKSTERIPNSEVRRSWQAPSPGIAKYYDVFPNILS